MAKYCSYMIEGMMIPIVFVFLGLSIGVMVMALLGNIVLQKKRGISS